MIVKITKLSDNKNEPIDSIGIKNGVLGYIKNEPYIGDQIVVFYADRNDSAMMFTTPVKAIEYSGNVWTVKTCNSFYKIEKVGD